jgi:ATP-dependent Lon protease
VGKTHFAKRLAAVFGVPQFVYLLESAETVAVLCGSERHWSTAAPGELWKLVVEGLFANPVVVLEELARAAQGGHYRPAQALHALLDPVTSRELRDKAVELQFDASFVSYVATTNSLDGIESSLLSRFEVFHVSEPAPREAVKVSKSICKEVLAELKLCSRFAMPAGEVIQQLSLLGGPRQVQKTFRAAVARAVSAGRSSLQINDLMAGFQVGAPKPAQRQRLH